MHDKRSMKDRKLTKKIKRVEGGSKEKHPPEKTPKWAISCMWDEEKNQSNK